MDIFNRENLAELLSEHRAPCISIYMPTFRKGAEVEQNSIRFKNKVRETEKILLDKGYRAPQVEKLLGRAKTLIDDHAFWNYQSEGLAVFIAEDKFYYYRIHEHFDEILLINDHFYVKPLIPYLSGNEFFYILSLDKKEIRLFKATRHDIRQIELKNVPVGINEYEQSIDAEPQGSFGHNETKNGREGFYSGPSGGAYDGRVDMKAMRFFKIIDRNIYDIIKKGNPPLVLAGVEYLIPLYREVNSYQNITETAVTLNTDLMSMDELHSHALKAMEPYFRKTLESHLFQYEQLFDSEKVSEFLPNIITAAFSRRVSVLFFNPKIQVWGRFNSVDYSVEIHDKLMPGDEDLLNLAAVQTLAYDGTVYALKQEEMPTPEPAAAIYRF